LLMEQEFNEARVFSQNLSTRRAILQKFLRSLVRYETNEDVWEGLIEKDFWLKQPVTLFRGFNGNEIEDGPCRISRGIKGVISEAASLSVMIDSIGSRSNRWMEWKASEFFDERKHVLHPDAGHLTNNAQPGGGNHVRVHQISHDLDQGSDPQIWASFHVSEDEIIITNEILMCPYTFSSRGAILCGAVADINISGMIRATFSPSANRLLTMELVYDPMGFIQQLENANGGILSVPVVPNCLETATSLSTTEAGIITLASPPFPVVYVNDEWMKLTKISQQEARGECFSIVSGAKADLASSFRPGKPTHSCFEVAKGHCACSVHECNTKHGDRFLAFVCSYPLAK